MANKSGHDILPISLFRLHFAIGAVIIIVDSFRPRVAANEDVSSFVSKVPVFRVEYFGYSSLQALLRLPEPLSAVW